jgi:hypothetical protein
MSNGNWKPDFLMVHCNNEDRSECAVCGRDFIIPVSAIAVCQRTPENTVSVFMQRNLFGMHNCIGNVRVVLY